MNRLFFSLSLVVVLTSVVAHAQWSSDPRVNTPICTAPGGQFNSIAVSDGSGGAFIVWEDRRNGNCDIYVQWIDANGIARWSYNGLAICVAQGDHHNPAPVADGNGGVIVTWYDIRNDHAEVFAQRVSSSGETQWALNGIPICTASGWRSFPAIVQDGSGGAVIMWEDRRMGDLNADIYAQRINASGTVQWPINGVPVCNAYAQQRHPTIIADGAGGCIVSWYDTRDGDPHIYAQRMNFNGSAQWIHDGAVICSALGSQYNPVIGTDGAGGAIIAWVDHRIAGGGLYAQRINAAGVVQWAMNGVPVCAAALGFGLLAITPDGNQGAIVAWSRVPEADIYAQRINAGGLAQWTVDGVAVCTANGLQVLPRLLGDGAGGAILTWDNSYGSPPQVYAQYIASSGSAKWAFNGKPLRSGSGGAGLPTIVSNGAGGAIVAWDDSRGGGDIYTQRINADGSLGYSSLVVNGGFEPDGAPWWFYDNGYPPGSGAVRPPIVPWRNEPMVARIAPHAFGSNIQFWQDGICLEPNTQYRLSFDAEVVGTPSGYAGVAVTLSGINVNYGLEWWRPAVTASWQHFEVTFTSRNISTPVCNARLQFQMGGVAGFNAVYSAYYFDNVVIERVIHPPYITVSGHVSSPWGDYVFNVPTLFGFPEPVMTDGGGNYSTQVPFGWSGTVTTAIGQVGRTRCSPAARTYTNLTADQTNQDYAILFINVWGSIKDPMGVPIAGVKVKFDTDSSLTDNTGNYSLWWRGTGGIVVPAQLPYAFDPPQYQPYFHHFTPAPVSVSFVGTLPFTNAVVNGAFDLGSEPWWFYDNGYPPGSGAVRPTIVDESDGWPNPPATFFAQIAPHSSGYNIQFWQDGICLEPNSLYQLTFKSAVQWSSSTAPQGFAVTLSGVNVNYGVDQWRPLGSSDYGWRYYGLQFTTRNFSTRVCNARLQFQMGGVAGYDAVCSRYSFDNIRLVRIGAAKQAAKVATLPTEYRLEQNYPNPFNPNTTIKYQLPIANHVTLKVYDMLGREVATLVDADESEGYKSVQFDASKLASGVYVYRFQADRFTVAKRLLVLK